MKTFWISLPVKDINKSRAFFTSLGFRFNTQHGNGPNSACLLIGDANVACMLFDEPTFAQCLNGASGISDKGSEVILSVDAQSKEEVDEMAQKAVVAGGTSNHKPSEMNGFMYGCLFMDLDGHSWNVLYMDMSKMPKS